MKKKLQDFDKIFTAWYKLEQVEIYNSLLRLWNKLLTHYNYGAKEGKQITERDSKYNATINFQKCN